MTAFQVYENLKVRTTLLPYKPGCLENVGISDTVLFFLRFQNNIPQSQMLDTVAKSS